MCARSLPQRRRERRGSAEKQFQIVYLLLSEKQGSSAVSVLVHQTLAQSLADAVIPTLTNAIEKPSPHEMPARSKARFTERSRLTPSHRERRRGAGKLVLFLEPQNLTTRTI